MVENSQGQIAIVRITSSNPHNLFIQNNKLIHFEPRSSISLAWVDKEDVEIVLAVRDRNRCCGGANSPIFRYATQQQVNIWSGISSR